MAAEQVFVVYSNRGLGQTVIGPESSKPVIRSDEKIVTLGIGFYRQFHSLEDFCRAVPALVPFADRSG